MEPVVVFDWHAHLVMCAGLLVQAATWTAIARYVGRGLRGVGRG